LAVILQVGVRTKNQDGAMPELLSDVTQRLINDRRGRLIVRAAVCHLLAHHHHQTVPEIAKTYFSEDKDLNRAAPFTLVRAAVVPTSLTGNTQFTESASAILTMLLQALLLHQTCGLSDFNFVLMAVAQSQYPQSRQALARLRSRARDSQ
jgi:hypothetical protein